MNTPYETSFDLYARDCDIDGRWRPESIFLAMQDASVEHSSRMGSGYFEMRAQGVAWVLTRIALRMMRYPRMGERVVLRTWPAKSAHAIYPRFFELETSAGESVGAASSLWTLIDLDKRAIAIVSDAEARYEPCARKPPLSLPGAANPIEGEVLLDAVYAPKYADFDINGHVNNTRYVRWLCDALGLPTLREARMRGLTVNYAREILPGQAVALRLLASGREFSMQGSVDGVPHFSMRGELGKAD